MDAGTTQTDTPASYLAILEHEAGTLWGVWFPDLPGCTTAGETAEDARHRSVEALRLYTADMVEEGATMPAARGIDDLRADPDVAASLSAGGVVLSVPVLVNDAAPRRVNVSIDGGALRAIDAAARRRGMSRSAFLVSTALEKIATEA